MTHPPNLVPDSADAEETIALLRLCGGRARLEQVAGAIFNVADADSATARALFDEFLKDDWRFSLNDGGEVEMICADHECLALDAADYVVLDVETTGSGPKAGRVMEIGAYRVSRGRIVAEFQTLVNPLEPIPEFISGLTGITEQMVADSPRFEEIACEMLGFIGESVLVAHNSDFDVRFLNGEIGRLYPRRKMFNASLCTLRLSRRLLPGLLNYRLHTVAEHFNVSIRNRHRAPGDAEATAHIFIGLLELLRAGGVNDLGGARRYEQRGEPRGKSRRGGGGNGRKQHTAAV
jgi:DNA polymerase III epsilon subunit family exonuclease